MKTKLVLGFLSFVVFQSAALAEEKLTLQCTNSVNIPIDNLIIKLDSEGKEGVTVFLEKGPMKKLGELVPSGTLCKIKR